MSKCMSVKEIAEVFGITPSTVFKLFRTKGSPAFKVGTGSSSSWRCYEQDFKEWLLKRTESEKG